MRYLLFSLLLAGCHATDGNGGGCATDKDCKADRVCDPTIRLCVDPGFQLPDMSPAVSDFLPMRRCQPTDPQHKSATNSLLLPGMSGSYSIDIDGDGKPDNKFKSVISAISVAGFDLVQPLMREVADGSAVVLMDVQAADLANGCATPILGNAVPAVTPPKFDGTDMFHLDGTPVFLSGNIIGGELSTILPKDQKQADVRRFMLQGFGLQLVIYGAHVQGKVTTSGIMNGELHGVIRQKDIDGTIIPAIATVLTKTVNDKPNDSSSKAIIMLFEDMTNPITQMKCKDMTKCCATNPTTCVILPDELRASSLIQNVLSADVQMFDNNGNWAPVPRGPSPDSLSMGLGFTAVLATF